MVPANTPRASLTSASITSTPRGRRHGRFARRLRPDQPTACLTVAEPRISAVQVRTIRGPSYDVVEVVRAALGNGSAVVGMRLDVEGATPHACPWPVPILIHMHDGAGLEYDIIDALLRAGLICRLSYLFVEFHSTAVAQQARFYVL